MTGDSSLSKTTLARNLGISRASLYYEKKQPQKDWTLKCRIEEIWRTHPSYGHKRLSIELRVNRKRVRRVMKLYSLKPYRRRGRKWLNRKPVKVIYPNLLLTEYPSYPSHIWASDFTRISFQGKVIYLATVIDLYTREIVGFSVLNNHSVILTVSAFLNAVMKYPKPEIFHSDQGSEYKAEDQVSILENLHVLISMAHPGCPWENGYQESFYSQFKVDLGDPNRFNTLGELVHEIYLCIHKYNTSRIHTALKMPPSVFGQNHNAEAPKWSWN